MTPIQQAVTNFEATLTCPVSFELLTEGVSLDPCHHKLQETIAKILYSKGLATCPVCNIKVTSYGPDCEIRSLAQIFATLKKPKQTLEQLPFHPSLFDTKKNTEKDYPGNRGEFELYDGSFTVVNTFQITFCAHLKPKPLFTELMILGHKDQSLAVYLRFAKKNVKTIVAYLKSKNVMISIIEKDWDSFCCTVKEDIQKLAEILIRNNTFPFNYKQTLYDLLSKGNWKNFPMRYRKLVPLKSEHRLPTTFNDLPNQLIEKIFKELFSDHSTKLNAISKLSLTDKTCRDVVKTQIIPMIAQKVSEWSQIQLKKHFGSTIPMIVQREKLEPFIAALEQDPLVHQVLKAARTFAKAEKHQKLKMLFERWGVHPNLWMTDRFDGVSTPPIIGNLAHFTLKNRYHDCFIESLNHGFEPEMFNILLPDVSSPEPNMRTLLDATIDSEIPYAISLCFRRQAMPHLSDSYTLDTLCHAVNHRDLTTVQLLYHNNWPISSEALRLAIVKEHGKILKYFLESIGKFWDSEYLFYAIQNEKVKSLKIIISWMEDTKSELMNSMKRFNQDKLTKLMESASDPRIKTLLMDHFLVAYH